MSEGCWSPTSAGAQAEGDESPTKVRRKDGGFSIPNSPDPLPLPAPVVEGSYEYADGEQVPYSYTGSYYVVGAKQFPHGEGRKDVSGIGMARWVYEGNFSRALRWGQGELYQGSWEEGGTKYNGQWRNDVKHGIGVLTSKEGQRYEGQWHNDKWEVLFTGSLQSKLIRDRAAVWSDYLACRLQGQGKLTLPDGRSYCGSWRGSKRHGKGTVLWPDGKTYEGQYVNDVEHGHGVETLTNGEVYTGGWSQGRRHGRGQLSNAKSGNQYDMQYERGMEQCRMQTSRASSTKGRAPIGLSPFVYKLDSGWESQMLSRMGSQQSMSLLAKADTARFDAQKLARDVVCFLQDSHTGDRDKCQWVDSRADSPWRGRKLLRVPQQHSSAFGQALMNLCSMVIEILKDESPLLELSTPCSVIGDIHGNFTDMEYLSEVLAYLLAQKVLAPTKWFLLRGNHELRAVNGDEETYGLGCYLTQCRLRFGDTLGKHIWEACNKCFDFLPVAAVIDEQEGGIDSRLDDIRSLPQPFDPSYPVKPDDTKGIAARNIMMDILWGDPASELQTAKLNESGFLARTAEDDPKDPTTPRHLCYGIKFLDDFFQKNHFNRLLRGHQAVAGGIGVSMGTRVLTVFSDSKDHFDHEVTQCGIILVEDEISVITGVPQPAATRAVLQPVGARGVGTNKPLRPAKKVTQASHNVVTSTDGGKASTLKKASTALGVDAVVAKKRAHSTSSMLVSKSSNG